jgi:K+-sensing histidine kinase KdpD
MAVRWYPVRNTGPAIPPGQVDRLFQPFQRLGTERVQRSRGHGLGLAIVAAIADAHAASITARVRQGGGLDIAVAFPQRARISSERRRAWPATSTGNPGTARTPPSTSSGSSRTC